MEQVYILRKASSDEGTPGLFIIPGVLKLASIELPWRDNRRQISHIPEGEYVCEPWRSRRFGRTWKLVDVPGRSNILIHRGNFAGDTEAGLKSNSWGCILLGTAAGKIGGQEAVIGSVSAMRILRDALPEKPFMIHIQGRH